MKRCPDCYEVYDEGEKFCELDGQQLLADPTIYVDIENPATNYDNVRTEQQPWLIGFVGVMVGFLICAVFVAVALWSFDPYSRDEEAPVHASQMQEIQSNRREAGRIPEYTAEPTDDSLAESEAEPIPELPESSDAEANQAVAAHLLSLIHI